MTKQSTLIELFQQQVSELRDQPALLTRQGPGSDLWREESWVQWNERSRAIAAALIDAGISPDDHVGVFSYSRPEWVEADMGVQMAGARTVTVYHNLTAESVRYIVDDSQTKLIVAEGPIQLRALFDENGELPQSVKQVVYIDERQTPLPRPTDPNPAELSLADAVPESKRSALLSLEEFVARGKALLADNPAMLDAPIAGLKSDSVAKVVYTSGTTGMPKGAMLTHRNLLAVVDSVQQGLKLNHDDMVLLFLPLAHVYAQLTYHVAVRVGFSIAFAQSMLTAVEDAQSVKPTFFTTVPRLFEKIHSAVLTAVEEAGGLKKKLFLWASDVGSQVVTLRQQGVEPGGLLAIKYGLANKLVFSKLQARLGGRIRYLISGGAPLAHHICEFFHAANLPILEGYGMTEDASLSHYNRAGNVKFGTVGIPIPGIEVRIAEDGEILIRGPNVMKGYLGKPEATAEVIDEDGWLHTGDIGTEDHESFLTITDRKKAIIVTSGGKNIAPAPIENALTKSRFISQAMVVGDNRKFLIALLALDQDHVRNWAKDKGIPADDFTALIERPELKEAVDAELTEVNSHLDSFSTVKKVAFLPRDLTIQDGEITPSLKVKRKVVEKRFADLINDLYPQEPSSYYPKNPAES